VLEQQLQFNPESRAALSLLGYCYYYLGMFPEAASMYEHLIRLHPDVDDYKVHYSKSLYKVTRFRFLPSFPSFPFLFPIRGRPYDAILVVQGEVFSFCFGSLLNPVVFSTPRLEHYKVHYSTCCLRWIAFFIVPEW
jgi:tetratricopeptide (TPR) repeat protein